MSPQVQIASPMALGGELKSSGLEGQPRISGKVSSIVKSLLNHQHYELGWDLFLDRYLTGAVFVQILEQQPLS